MKKTIATLLTCLIILSGYGQLQPIDVAELTIKIGGMSSEEMFYGFAKDDQIVFNFEELKGKELKEIEIIELPNNSKFMDYKTVKIENKKISVNQKSLYQFKFNNSAISGRICKVKIQRIPKTEDLTAFNTNWEWKTLYDTTYVPYNQDSLIGYETVKIPYTKNELIRIDTTFKEFAIAEKNQVQIHSRGNLKACFGKSESCTKYKELISYPSNTETLIVWVGIGQESRQQYLDLTKTLTKIAVKGAITTYSAGSSLLINGLTDQATDQAINSLPTSKNEVDIYFTDEQNATFWYNDYENRINTYNGLQYPNQVKFYKKFTKEQIPSNSMYICIKNNSYSVPVDISLGVVAVCFDKIYEDKNYIREEQKPIYVKLNKKRMVVNTRKIRVNAK